MAEFIKFEEEETESKNRNDIYASIDAIIFTSKLLFILIITEILFLIYIINILEDSIFKTFSLLFGLSLISGLSFMLIKTLVSTLKISKDMIKINRKLLEKVKTLSEKSKNK